MEHDKLVKSGARQRFAIETNLAEFRLVPTAFPTGLVPLFLAEALKVLFKTIRKLKHGCQRMFLDGRRKTGRRKSIHDDIGGRAG